MRLVYCGPEKWSDVEQWQGSCVHELFILFFLTTNYKL